MITVTLYQCEVCGIRYDDREGAEQCESRGRPPTIPIGTIISDGAYMHGISLLQVLCLCEAPGRAHALNAGYWTFRDGPGNLGDTGPMSGMSANGPLIGDTARAHMSGTVPVDTSSPRYARAFGAMREAGLPLYLWVNGVAVHAPPPTGKA